MAKQIITKMLDDIDGGEADETVSFAVDGTAYEIDLSARNAVTFREFMSTYQAAGTRIGRALNGSPAQMRSYRNTPSSGNQNREENMKIRSWALNNGYDLSDRGRIPTYIVEAYNSNTPNPVWVAEQAALAELAPQEEEEVQPPRRRSSKRSTPAPAAFSGT